MEVTGEMGGRGVLATKDPGKSREIADSGDFEGDITQSEFSILNRFAKNHFGICRRLSKSGFNCLSKSGQQFLIFWAA